VRHTPDSYSTWQRAAVLALRAQGHADARVDLILERQWKRWYVAGAGAEVAAAAAAAYLHNLEVERQRRLSRTRRNSYGR